jgi:polyketide cyclase/dehydrase/lipid transport protein
MSYDAQTLDQSTDMRPVEGSTDIAVPIDTLWECFAQANEWPRWNSCMFWVKNRDLILGQELVWVFQPIRRWYLYKLPARAKIVELEVNRKVTWEVRFLPGFYARHTYSMEDLSGGRSRFGSWEKVQGPLFRLLSWFWMAHFVFVKDRSLEGARLLESVYTRTGKLDLQAAPLGNR